MVHGPWSAWRHLRDTRFARYTPKTFQKYVLCVLVSGWHLWDGTFRPLRLERSSQSRQRKVPIDDSPYVKNLHGKDSVDRNATDNWKKATKVGALAALRVLCMHALSYHWRQGHDILTVAVTFERRVSKFVVCLSIGGMGFNLKLWGECSKFMDSFLAF